MLKSPLPGCDVCAVGVMWDEGAKTGERSGADGEPADDGCAWAALEALV